MNKKLIVVIGIVGIIGAGMFKIGLGLKNQDKNLEVVQHSQEWTIPAKEIKEICVEGLDQELEIEVKRSNNPQTKVIFEGETSADLQKRMKKIKAKKNALNLDLEKKGISISMKGKATELKGKIRVVLGKDTLLETLKSDTTFANTTIALPEDLAVKAYPKTKEGEVNTIKNDRVAETIIKTTSESGDIFICKK